MKGYHMIFVKVQFLYLWLVVVYPEIKGETTHLKVNYSLGCANASDVDSSSNCFNQSVTFSREYKDYPYDYAVHVLAAFVLQPLLCFGVSGNIAILIVWSAESVFNPITFLMKCLAVSDIILLLSICLHSFGAVFHWNIIRSLLTMSVLLCFRIVSAHITLAIVFSRWLAVYTPLKVHSVLTKRRVVLGFILILMWCLTASVPTGLNVSGTFENTHTFTLINITEVVYLALPVLLLVVFNVSMIHTIQTRSSTLAHERAVSHGNRSSQHARLVVAVLCLSVTTVLAYPLGVVSRLYFNLSSTSVYSPVVRLVVFISIVLEAFNSSINVVYYLAFVSQFRHLFYLRCCCCCRYCRKSEPQERSHTRNTFQNQIK